jgi:hypothetical protein
LAENELLIGHCIFFANDIADQAMLDLFCMEHESGGSTNEQFVEIGDMLSID